MTFASAFLFLDLIQRILLRPSARRVNQRRSWLRHCATSRKFAGISPIGSLRVCIQLTLGSTQLAAEINTRCNSWEPMRRAIKLSNFMCRLPRNSRSLSLLEHYGPVQSCIGKASPSLLFK
jgi:hypothetical protein